MQRDLPPPSGPPPGFDFGIDYPQVLLTDLDAIDARLAELAAERHDDPAAWQALHRLLHDVKGQGGSFDYWLASWVADRSCRLLRAVKRDFALRGARDGPVPAALQAHAAALRRIAVDRLTGEAGEAGTRLKAAIAVLDEPAFRAIGGAP